MLTAAYIQHPPDARVGDYFVADHPCIDDAYVVARVPPPQLPTEHGVLFWTERDGSVDDVEQAKPYGSYAAARSIAGLLNRF